MPEYSPSNAKVTKVEPMPPSIELSMPLQLTGQAAKPADEAKWIRLNKVTYTDPSGKSRLWESAERQTRPKDSDCDGVGVVAILNDPKSNAGPSLLLQKQFRPPIDRVTIEVPSGLIDEGETAITAAIRELKEETGYIATIPKDTSGNDTDDRSPDITKAAEGFLMFNDPGFCNTNTKMIFVEVDMTDPRNQKENLQPELEENEYIESFTLPLDDLWNGLAELDRQGYAIDARVGTLAQGMEIAKKWRAVLDKTS